MCGHCNNFQFLNNSPVSLMQVVVWSIEQGRTAQLEQAMDNIGVSFAVKEEETKFTWSNLDGEQHLLAYRAFFLFYFFSMTLWRIV